MLQRLSVGRYTIPEVVRQPQEIPFGHDGTTVQIPQTVNVVSTTHLLPQEIDPVTRKRRYTIPLPALAEYLPGAQYTPKAFASVICRLREGNRSFTVLYFKSGRCLVVRQQCPEHARYVVQVIRLMLQNAPVLVRAADGSIQRDTLGKYLTLKEWRIENIVVSGNLGMRINLAQLAASAAGKIKYAPGNFPGAEFEMRLRDATQCTCTKSRKCGCKVTVMCFDSGKLNIAGLRDAVEGNAIFYTLRSVIGDFQDRESIVPKEQRYDARIARFAHYLALNAEQRAAETLVKRRKVQHDQDKEDEEDEDEPEEINVDALEEEMQLIEALDMANDEDNDDDEGNVSLTTNLMRACDKRQVKNVLYLLESGLENAWAVDEHGDTALDRLRKRPDREDADNHLIAVLEAHMKIK